MAKVNYELLYPELNEYIEKNYTKNAEAKAVVGQSTFSDTLLARTIVCILTTSTTFLNTHIYGRFSLQSFLRKAF